MQLYLCIRQGVEDIDEGQQRVTGRESTAMGPSDHCGEIKSDKGAGRRLEGLGGSWGRRSQERMPLVVGFSRQEYWSEVPLPSPAQGMRGT